MDKLYEIEKKLRRNENFTIEDKVWLIETVKQERNCFSLLELAVKNTYEDENVTSVKEAMTTVFKRYHTYRNLANK